MLLFFERSIVGSQNSHGNPLCTMYNLEARTPLSPLRKITTYGRLSPNASFSHFLSNCANRRVTLSTHVQMAKSAQLAKFRQVRNEFNFSSSSGCITVAGMVYGAQMTLWSRWAINQSLINDTYYVWMIRVLSPFTWTLQPP